MNYQVTADFLPFSALIREARKLCAEALRP